MSEAFDWAEVGRVVGVGFGMVILILSGLAVILEIFSIAIRKIEKRFGLKEKSD